MRQYLQTCAQIEKKAAEIYRLLSESAHYSLEVRQIFQSLANDEEDHAHQLDFALRFPTGTATAKKDLWLGQATVLLHRVEELQHQVDTAALPLAQAAELAAELEGEFCRIHLENSVRFQDERMRAMFAAMARSEESHLRKLAALKRLSA